MDEIQGRQSESGILTFPYDYDKHIPNVSLSEFMLERMQTFGNRTACVDAETKRSLNYSEISANIKALAAGLQIKFDLKPRENVAVALSNCVEYPVVTLAINLCGASATLFNPAQTVYELKHGVKLTSPKIWIADGNVVPKLKQIYSESLNDPPVILATPDTSSLATLDELIALGKDVTVRPANIVPKEDTAFILFSSGTTGLPKGVMLTHFNFVAIRRLVEELHKFMRRESAESTNTSSPTKSDAPFPLVFLPFFHTFALNVLFDYLATGVPYVVLPKYSLTNLLKAIEEFKITVITVVPPIAIQLAKLPVEKQFNLSSLQDVKCGGAPVSKDILAALMSKFNVTASQAYGMTETIRSHGTVGKCLREGSIGVIFPFCESKVVDIETNEPQGSLKEGEICVRGALIMKGYIGDDEATKRMIDPDGWLHTGDVGYYDKDGFFFLTDRCKELIKYNGFQLSPSELEAIILTHPGVLDVGVAPVPDEAAGELPRAYVVKKPGVTNLSEAEIADFVSARVSGYKRLRGGVQFVEAIPKNNTGKILRGELKKLNDKFVPKAHL